MATTAASPVREQPRRAIARGRAAPATPIDHGDKHKYLIALAVVLASMMQVIDTSIVNVAIPHMMGNLGASLDEIAWVSTGYILACVIVIPLTGFFADAFGRKKYFAASIIIFTVASVFCGASHSLGSLIFWRVIQGLGGGALLATSQAILFEAFPKEEIGMAMAMFGLGVMVGPTLGPTLGGWLTDTYSWPWIFYINIPIGIAATVMVIAYVHDKTARHKNLSIDYIGITLLIISVGALQYTVEHGQREGWFESGLITKLAITTIVGSALLVWREMTTKKPAIDFRVLKYRQMWIGVVISVIVGIGLFGSVFILPIFLQGTLRLTAWQTGIVILPGAIATAFAMAFVGRLGNKIDPRLMIVGGSALFAIAMWQLSHITSQSGTSDFFWPLIWRGLGLGFVFVPLTTMTLSDIPLREMAQASGLFNFFRQIGGSLGIAGMATLLTKYTSEGHAILAEHVTAVDPASQARIGMLTRAFMARGADYVTANRAAMTVIDRQILGQASVIAFSKIYLLSGIILVISLPLLLLIKKSKSTTKVEVHME